MDDLKPCPFCGCKSVSVVYYDPYDGYQGNLGVYRVLCHNCHAQIERDTKIKAIVQWNRRAGND